MFAIAFDLTVAEVIARHPRSVTAAYDEIGRVLGRHGFEWRQGSVYTSDDEDLADLVTAMNALKSLPWFPRRFATSAPSGWSSGPISRHL